MVGWISTAASAVTVYTNRSAWESAVGAAFTEDFSDAVAPPVIVDGTVVDLSNGVTMTGVGAGGLAFLGTGGSPAFPTKHVETDFETINTKLVFDFPEPILGFGFDYAAADVNAVWITSPAFGAFAAPTNPSETVPAFIGVTSVDPFSSFAIADAAADQAWYMDNLSYQVVPEPAFPVAVLIALSLMRPAGKRRV